MKFEYNHLHRAPKFKVYDIFVTIENSTNNQSASFLADVKDKFLSIFYVNPIPCMFGPLKNNLGYVIGYRYQGDTLMLMRHIGTEIQEKKIVFDTGKLRFVVEVSSSSGYGHTYEFVLTQDS